MEVGKLYVCEEYFLLLFPDPDTAYEVAAAAVAAAATELLAASAAHWSEQFGKPVSYVEKNVPLLVLNSKDKCVEVLAGDRKGWIVCNKWLKIKEIDHA